MFCRPMRERFRVTVVDEKSNARLAETMIYRKSWMGDLPRAADEQKDPRHCPDRDRAIGRMLE